MLPVLSEDGIDAMLQCTVNMLPVLSEDGIVAMLQCTVTCCLYCLKIVMLQRCNVLKHIACTVRRLYCCNVAMYCNMLPVLSEDVIDAILQCTVNMLPVLSEDGIVAMYCNMLPVLSEDGIDAMLQCTVNMLPVRSADGIGAM
jgi:hypothetical protein